jgi:hypothetical protein
VLNLKNSISTQICYINCFNTIFIVILFLNKYNTTLCITKNNKIKQIQIKKRKQKHFKKDKQQHQQNTNTHSEIKMTIILVLVIYSHSPNDCSLRAAPRVILRIRRVESYQDRTWVFDPHNSFDDLFWSQI